MGEIIFVAGFLAGVAFTVAAGIAVVWKICREIPDRVDIPGV